MPETERTPVFDPPLAPWEPTSAPDPGDTEVRTLPADLEEDAEPVSVEETTEGRGRYRNSLGFSDWEVATLLRHDHFGGVQGVDVAVLHRLARAEEDLMGLGVALGHAFRDTWRGPCAEDVGWWAALRCTRAPGDRLLLDALGALEMDWTDEAARALAWAALPHLGALHAAARWLPDPAGLWPLWREVQGCLAVMEELVRDAPRELRERVADLPREARGVYRFRGFRWEPW